jgi:hypothetical protein
MTGNGGLMGESPMQRSPEDFFSGLIGLWERGRA